MTYHPSPKLHIPTKVPPNIQSIRPVIHPSKFLIREEEDDGRGGGGRMAAAAVYPNVYVIQSCSL
jgi:hypothetical protein